MLERELAETLDEYCRRTGRNKTWVVEAALRDYFEKHKDEE